MHLYICYMLRKVPLPFLENFRSGKKDEFGWGCKTGELCELVATTGTTTGTVNVIKYKNWTYTWLN